MVRTKEVDGTSPPFPQTPASRTISVQQPQTLLSMKQAEDAPPILATASDIQVIFVQQPQTPNVQQQQAVAKTKQILVPPKSVSKRPQPIVNQALFTQYHQTNKEAKQFKQQKSQIQQQQHQQFSQSSQQQLLHNQQLFTQQHQQPRLTAPQTLSSLKPIPPNKIVGLHRQQMVGSFGHQRLTGQKQLKPAETGGGKRPLLQIALKEQDAHFRALESQAKRYKSDPGSQHVISVADTQKQTIVKLPLARVVIDRIQVPNQGGDIREFPSKIISKASAEGNQSPSPAAHEMRTSTLSEQQQQQQPPQLSPETELKTTSKNPKQIKSKPAKRKTEGVEDESPKNKSPKETTKRKWKVAPDSQQKEGVVTRLRFQKDIAAKKLSPPRTQYAQKLRSAQVQQKEKETKTKRTRDAILNACDEIIKDILTESSRYDSNDSRSHESKVKTIDLGTDEEDIITKPEKNHEKRTSIGKADNGGNISDFEETSSEPEIGNTRNPIQANLNSSQDELNEHQESRAGEKYSLLF